MSGVSVRKGMRGAMKRNLSWADHALSWDSGQHSSSAALQLNKDPDDIDDGAQTL